MGRFLLCRQRDVETDGRRARFPGTSVRGLHDARATACRNHVHQAVLGWSQRAAAFGSDSTEGARLFVPARVSSGAVLAHPCAAEHDERGRDLPSPQRFLGLGILQQET